MFYSNQILTSTQYGVSTIWLIATVGKSHKKRVTKRAIQDVNVPRACEKILDPGAPLALRLQGNLLYGVSRVFADQCNYVLSDAEKTQSDMMMFFRAIKSSNLDLPMAKAKRVSITLQDDPNFDPTSQLPPLDLNIINADWLTLPSQESASKYSQMTPLQAIASRQSSGNRKNTFINIDLPPSSHSPGSYCLPSHLGKSSSPAARLHNLDDMPDFVPFQMDDFDPIADIGLDFDAQGNLIGVPGDEPELPPFFQDTPTNVSKPASGAQPPVDDYLMMTDQQILPDADAFPTVALPSKSLVVSVTGESTTTSTTEVVQMTAPLKRRRAGRAPIMVDDEICLRRSVQKHWVDNYATIMNESLHQIRSRGTAPGQAKKNALSFLLDNGIASVGGYARSLGVAHPLAAEYGGLAILAQLRPDTFAAEQRIPSTPSGRRRTSAEAFGDDGHLLTSEQQHRNVRAKYHDGNDAETGRGLYTDNLLAHSFGSQDDSHYEMGMDAAPGMVDHHSSSLMPWSRQGSVIPGSSAVRGAAAAGGPGSARKLAPSPLLHKSTHIGAALDRHSDDLAPGTDAGDDDLLAAFGSGHADDESSLMNMDPVLDFDAAVYAGLDQPSQEFLDYASKRAVMHGHQDDNEPVDAAKSLRGRRRRHRQWVDFEDIADPARHSKAIAAQAFLHILSLATRGVIAVQQENNDQGTDPFGVLNVGIDIIPE